MSFNRLIQLFQYIELKLCEFFFAVQRILHTHAVISNAAEVQIINKMMLAVNHFFLFENSRICVRMLHVPGIIHHSVYLFRNMLLVPRIILMHALDIDISDLNFVRIIVQIQLSRHIDCRLESRYRNCVDHS